MGTRCSTSALAITDVEGLDTFDTTPPEEHVLPTALGNTAVDVYNSECTETVVLVHGCGGTKMQFRDGRMSARLATRYRVVTLDWFVSPARWLLLMW